jgi:hypothetical protein
MVLSGDLSVFPLEEVLRLLARTRRHGELRIDVSGPGGRIYLSSGMLELATVSSDDDIRRQILNAGLTTEDGLRRVERGEATLAQVLSPGVPVAALADFVREISVESVYRIRKPGTGRFDFVLDARSPFPTGQELDIETVLREADRRAAEWADIETVVTDLRAPIRMVAELPDEQEVTLSASTWRILAALDGGAGIVDVADRLGLSEFRAAREVAGLLRAGLVEYVTAPVTTPVEDPTAGWWQTARPEPQPAEVAAEEPAEDTPEVREEEPEGGFLDAVFGQDDQSDEAEAGDDDDQEAGFGVGLLRRRRMVSRDVE